MKKRIIELNKTVKETINFEKHGFQLHSFSDIDFWYEYQRPMNEKIDFFNYGFMKDKWGDDTFLGAIYGRVVFPAVNKILLGLQKKSLITIQNLGEYDATVIRLPNFEIKDYHYLLKSQEVVKNREFNENAFTEALALFQEQLLTNVLPFFDKIQTLQQVNDEILEKVDWNTYNKYISGETGAKVLIIMKLCNNPRYEAYKQRSDKLIVAQLKDPSYAQYIDILQNQQIIMDEVYNYLESSNYLPYFVSL